MYIYMEFDIPPLGLVSRFFFFSPSITVAVVAEEKEAGSKYWDFSC